MGEAPPISTLPPGADRITEPTAFSNRKIEFHLARKPFNGFNSTADKGGFQLETLNSSSVPANPRGLEVQKAKSELVENHGMDPELLSFRIHFRKIGAGLANLGNTCFLNSVLQCLTYTEPLAAYLQSGKHQNSCRTAGFCALCAIQKHVSRALNSTGRIVAPKDLVSNLRCISRSFRNARQEDAHEYMVNLLESMHKCCLPSGIPSESPTAYERSLVHKIFGGRLRSQVKCTQCSYSSNKFDPFLDLSLEINKADSLYKALNHFTAKEELDGGEKQYQCQQCKQKVRASKQLTIHKPPHVLAIHLKRFGSHIQGHKIDKKVSFSPNLDLKPFVTGTDDVDLKYTLYGVLVHAGWSTHSGHYYSFVRTSTGMWYSLDDNRVVQVNERKVLEQKAYMLFYVRDARIPAPKKALEVGQKGNMVTSAIGNKSALNFNMGKSNVLGSRAVDASNVLPKKVIPVSDDVATKEVMQTGPTEKKSIVPCSQVVGEVDGSNGSVSVENKAISMSSNGQVACVKGVECLIEKTDLVIPQLDTKEDKSESSCNNGVVDVKKPVMSTLDTPLSGASEQVVSVSTDSQKNYDEEKSGVTLENGGVILPQSVNTNSQDVVSSKLCDVGEISKLKITLEKKSVDKKAHLGVKKKQLFKMQLSTKIIFGKKFRIPKRKIQKKNPEQEHVSNGPSSSESSSKKLSNGLKRKNCENIVVTESGDLNKRIDKEFRERVEKKPDMSHSFVEKRKDGNTKGCLEDTAVPQWDDVKLPTNGVFEESTGTQSSLTIGYVADEWDEEYDRGKRKKVRTNKVEFGGPNLFQEIATKKAKRKGAKLKSNSRNEPYRI